MKRLAAAAVLVVCLGARHPGAQDVSGVWEGELADPIRPTVLGIDLSNRTASFSGGAPVPLTNVNSVATRIEFDLGTVHVSAQVAGPTMAGTMVGPTRRSSLSLTRVPDPTPNANRVVSWHEDFEAVRTRFFRYDRSFTVATRETALRRLTQLDTSVVSQTDSQILVELSRIIALAGNAHTRLYFVRNRTDVRRIPIRVWWFRHELRIVRAAAADLLGCQVLRIGDGTVAEAFRRVRNLKAGNRSWQRYMTVYYLTSPDVLAGAGVIPQASSVALTLRCGGEVRRISLASPPLQRSTTAVEAWWDLVPQHQAVSRELLPALSADRTPRYLQRAQENYWFEYVPELNAIYIQYNRSESRPDEPMQSFAGRVAAAVTQRAIKALIIDVRFNTGGDLATGTPLVEALVPLVRRSKVFVLTGRSTFSAGITHAAQWKQAGAAVVGEPVGDGLDMWSEGGNLRLPHSGLTVHYTNAFHRYSTREYPDRRPYFMELNVPTLEPDLKVEASWEDYIAGRDPVLAAVAKSLAR